MYFYKIGRKKMLTFAYPGCTWVPDGPGCACWRADGPTSLISCADWAAACTVGPVTVRTCAVEPVMSWACTDGCTWAGSVEQGGFGQRPY